MPYPLILDDLSSDAETHGVCRSWHDECQLGKMPALDERFLFAFNKIYIVESNFKDVYHVLYIKKTN